MKWPFSFLSPKKSQAHNGELIDRYKEYRAAGRELNTVLAKQLPKPALQECGKKIGIYKAGTLILNNDDEIAILFDYGLYHYQRGGKNTIQRYLDNSPPPAESMDMALLQAMLSSWYSAFRIVDIHPHQGAQLLDLVSGKTIDLMDIGISETAEIGIIVLGRILPFDGFSMSSGTVIPVPEAVFVEKIKPILRKFLKSDEPGITLQLSSGQMASFVGEIIRVALHAGGEDNVFYTDVEA